MKNRIIGRILVGAFFASASLFIKLNGQSDLVDIISLTVGPTNVYQHDSSETNPLDPLGEGAVKLEELGVNAIKVWFNANRYAGNYPQNVDWSQFTVNSLKDLAQTTYYDDLFDRSFSVYFLEAIASDMADWKITGLNKFADGIDPVSGTAEYDHIYNEFYELTEYLYATFNGSGKTFILQNWEGDNALTNVIRSGADPQTAIGGMIDWMDARQSGVEDARAAAAALGHSGVNVYHALEANKVQNLNWSYRLVDEVVPHTACDLYSYSNYETNGNPLKIKTALDYFADQAPDSAAFGAKNVFLGEMAAPENLSWAGSNQAQLDILQAQLDHAIDWGIPYAVPWALYCTGVIGKTGNIATWGMNEGTGTDVFDGRSTNEGVKYGATWVSGSSVTGYGLAFDGVNDYVEIPDSSALGGMSDFTLYVKFKLNQLPWASSKYPIVNKDSSFRLEVDSGGYLSLLVGTDNNPMGGAGTSVQTGSALSVGQWYVVLATYEPDHANNEYLSLNLQPLGGSVSESVSTASISGDVFDSSSTLEFGGTLSGGEYFNGVIDRVTLYSAAFHDGSGAGDDDEITWFFDGYPVRNNDDMKGFWFRRFDGTYTYQWDYLYHLMSKAVMPGETKIDQLNNLTQAYSVSSNVSLGTNNAASNFEGDNSRAKRSSTADGELVFDLEAMDSFTAKLYYYGASISGNVEFYESPDASNWTQLSGVSFTGDVETENGWSRVYAEPTSILSAGTNYVKIKLTDGTKAYSPQLSSFYASNSIDSHVVDSMNDWSKTYSRSSGLALSTSTPVQVRDNFSGDSHRVKRTSDTLQEVVYNLNDANDFSVRIYYQAVSASSLPSGLSFKSSSDGVAWSSVSVGNTNPKSGSNNWHYADYSPNSSLPSGTNYLKVELSSDPLIYSPQIGTVEIYR